MELSEIIALEPGQPLPLPFYDQGISCGFPSPADDFVEQRLDLNKYLISKPNSTFLATAKGESMKGAGIFSGDILVIDKSLTPQHGHVAVCWIDGVFTVKRIVKDKGKILLVPENDAYEAIEVREGSELQIWGIVIGLARKMKL